MMNGLDEPVRHPRPHPQVLAAGRTFDLPAGRLLTLDRALPHDVEALEESAFLLTIAWKA